MLDNSGSIFSLGALGLGGTHGEVTLLNNGDFVVVWANTVIAGFAAPGTDVSGTAVAARIFAPDGTPRGPAFQVNTVEYLYQQDVEVTALTNGNFVVAWTDMPFGATISDAKARIYAPDGTPVTGEITLSSTTTGEQRIPQISETPGGGFLAIWNDGRAEVYGQFFDATGTASGPELIVPASFGERITMTTMDNGDVRYVSGNQLWQYKGAIFTSGSFNYLDSQSSSSFNTGFAQNFSTDITTLTNDRFAIAGVVQEATGYRIGVQVLTYGDISQGQSDNYVFPPGQAGKTLIVSDDVFPVNAQNLVFVDIAPLASGGFVVTWGHYTGTGLTAEFEIRARAVNADLTTNGDVVVVHSSTSDDQGQPFVTEMADGRIFIGWTDTGTEASTVPSDIVGKFLTLTVAPPTPTPNDDTLTGTSGDDLINGLAGNDSMTGDDGNDTLLGAAGNDTLIGGTGNDSLSGGADNDSLLGNQGSDTLLGQAGDDKLDGGLDADSVSGGDGNDTVIGGGGFDTLRGGNGDDTVNGGDGRDLAYLGGGNDLFIDNAQGGVNGRDTVYANAGNDTLGGGNGNDVFHGQDGNDRLLGRLGNDKLFGGNQNDTLVGGDGNDTVAGGNGRDRAFMGNGNDSWFDNAQVTFGDDSVVGGNGDDTIRSEAGNDTLSGGTGSDTFIFADTLGDVEITDFDTSADAIQMATALWVGTFDQAALDAMADTSSGSLVLTLNTGATLTFDNLTGTTGLLDDISLV